LSLCEECWSVYT